MASGCVTHGKQSLDQISLDLFTWSKVSVKFGVWSKLFFFTWSNFTWFFHLIKSSNNVILGFNNFWSSAKKEPTDFGTWSNVLLAKK